MGTGNYSVTWKKYEPGTLAVDGWAGHCVWYSEEGTGQAPPRCTKCNSPPINGQRTNHRRMVRLLLWGFNVPIKG